jgi:hypothetical protein
VKPQDGDVLRLALGGITGGDFSVGQRVAGRIGIVCLVADESLRIAPFERRLRATQIMGLTRREHHIDGIAECMTRT